MWRGPPGGEDPRLVPTVQETSPLRDRSLAREGSMLRGPRRSGRKGACYDAENRDWGRGELSIAIIIVTLQVASRNNRHDRCNLHGNVTAGAVPCKTLQVVAKRRVADTQSPLRRGDARRPTRFDPGASHRPGVQVEGSGALGGAASTAPVQRSNSACSTCVASTHADVKRPIVAIRRTARLSLSTTTRIRLSNPSARPM